MVNIVAAVLSIQLYYTHMSCYFTR